MNLQSTNISRINAPPPIGNLWLFSTIVTKLERPYDQLATIYRNNKEQRLSFIVASLETGRIGLIFDENEF